MKIIFHYHANKTHFHKKVFVLGLILRVRVFGTRKWPIQNKKNIKVTILVYEKNDDFPSLMSSNQKEKAAIFYGCVLIMCKSMCSKDMQYNTVE